MIPSVVCDVSNLFSIIANLIYDQNIGLSYFHAQGCSGWGTHLHKNIHTIGKVNFLKFSERKVTILMEKFWIVQINQEIIDSCDINNLSF